MYRLLLVLLSLPCLLSLGCGNNEDDCLSSDMTLEEYRTANNIQATEGDRGLYYVIQEPGDSLRPRLTSDVVVNYRGYTTEDETFDETTGSPRTFRLSNLIVGWQEGIPLIGKGGRIQLFVPSALAYGPSQVGNICSNTDLIFDIELVGFNDQ
ncbi:FKBP-type peptidyl-prolyl cis-trans isomerase [Neolewinella sp.]|uniref:FKBP-type peptidyl-prolyl cis-trans isomerase n=1 Tax=Neolewinella sp. TaxID=2993543 RepID=UPI003B517A11